MSADRVARVISLNGRPVSVPGYLNGMRSLCLQGTVTIDLNEQQIAQLPEINAVIGKLLPRGIAAPPGWPGNAPLEGVLRSAMHWAGEMQRVANHPVNEPGKVLARDRQNTSRFLYALPVAAHAESASALALGWVIETMNAAWTAQDLAKARPALAEVAKKLTQAAPQRINTLTLTNVAWALGIPHSVVAGHIYQFGQGARLRWLDSSFTDHTPQIGAMLARNKMLGAATLRRAGIPVPPHRLVASVEDALRAADELGYPVVVKPGDLDGGVGVASGLRIAQDVVQAYTTASKHSKQILVEKHVDGRDYRLLVMNGEVIWSLERVPPGVTGDGTRTVAQLIAQANADPRRGDGNFALLKKLKLDEQALSLLGEHGLTAETVPAAGQYVQLHRAANVFMGGMPVPVNDIVHPDNLALAVRAAAALALDVAGVDLLIPDIARSWLETGAAICEVNGQPSLVRVDSRPSHFTFMRKLIEGNGRIPIAVVLGDPSGTDVATAISQALGAAGLRCGRADASGVRIAEAPVTRAATGALAAGQMLLGDRGVQAMVMDIHNPLFLRTGLAFDRFDALVVAGTHSTPAPVVRGQPALQLPWVELLRGLLPACAGPVFVLEGADPQGVASREVPANRVRTLAGDLQASATAICEELVQADARHRMPPPGE